MVVILLLYTTDDLAYTYRSPFKSLLHAVHCLTSALNIQLIMNCNGVNWRPRAKESLMVARLNDIQGSGADVPQPETAQKTVAIQMNDTV